MTIGTRSRRVDLVDRVQEPDVDGPAPLQPLCVALRAAHKRVSWRHCAAHPGEAGHGCEGAAANAQLCYCRTSAECAALRPTPLRCAAAATAGRFDAEFLASRKIALERCLRRMVSHPILHQSSDLKLFLEEDNLEAAVRPQRPAQ